MNNDHIIFELNYHYLWLVKTLAEKDFQGTAKQLRIDPELLKIIKNLTFEELNILCLTEKTIFSWEIRSTELINMLQKTPYLPEKKTIVKI